MKIVVTGATGFVGRPLVRKLIARGHVCRFADLGPALDDLHPTYELIFEQWVPRSPNEVFPFFADARNLERVTPDFLRFQVLDVTPELIGDGTIIDYKLTLRGVPLRWQSVIEQWSPGRSFVDRQTRGPYQTWHHTHEFEPAHGGTVLRDRVRYAVPMGALGDTVAGAFVRRDVERTFEFRHAKIEEMFGRPRESHDGGEHGHAA